MSLNVRLLDLLSCFAPCGIGKWIIGIGQGQSRAETLAQLQPFVEEQ